MRPAPVVRAVLWPASALFEGLVLFHARLYEKGVFRRRRLAGGVISVGNLTVGGTGKTPMVLWLAERLLAEGKHVGILTRGYRGGEPAEAHGMLLSDEVALLRARLGGRVQFGIGRDRYAKGLVLEQHGVGWFVLDDGFQHLQLARDADIVLLDATDPFGGGHVLPVGRLREPRSALGRADIVVITRSERAPAIEALVRQHTEAPVFYAQTHLKALLSLLADQQAPEPVGGDWRGLGFFAFCGIGNPAAFFDDVRRWGMSIAGTAAYRDHHRYSQSDADELEQRAAAAGAEALLTTEKDVFNLRGVRFRTRPIYFCQISLAISNEEGLWRAVLDAIERNRAKALP
jgi:tetraacyldisaccharide 4'-kinase